jgi:thymidylate synthase (FAD)
MSTPIEFRSEMDVRLIDSMGHDLAVTRSAQVSVRGENNPDTDSPRLINYLMSSRHGSPFEHSIFTWYVSAPLFVFREFQRHRIASYNEMSGRYTKLEPWFYRPAPERPLVNVNTSARPEFAAGTAEQYALVMDSEALVFQHAWDAYEEQIEAGVANEIARTVLPLAIYSQMYVTMNARSLMNFLGLRVDSPDATHRTRPQQEIQAVAWKMEQDFADAMPHTYASFVKNGRVAP